MPIVIAAYGVAAYIFFTASFLYAIGFVGGFLVPKTIDSGPAGDPWVALVVDLALLTLFAVQHSVMARPAFKRWWTQFVPEAAERSTYVVFATSALVLLMAFWQPLPTVVWTTEGIARMVVLAVFWGGWAVLLISTFLINHFELFGLKQAMGARSSHTGGAAPVLRTPLFYRFVRHPLYLGFVIAFWAAPVMSVGHLVFALASTGYIFVGIALEERDLVAVFGQVYRDYRKRTGMLLPRIAPRK
jgi:methanethiol S-methyltransferase